VNQPVNFQVSRPLVIAAAVILLAIVILPSAAYKVDEAEQAVILQFGRPVGQAITTPGLKFKLPFIQEVRKFDKRIMQWDVAPTQIPTLDQEFIMLDSTARWRIVDPLTFLQSVQTINGAMSRIGDVINTSVRNNISANQLFEIVRSKSWDPDFTRLDEQEVEKIKMTGKVNIGREEIIKSILEGARQSMDKFGVELIDVRIKRLNYVPSVREQIYEEMISDRLVIADSFRAEGKGRSDSIRGEVQRDVDIIISTAKRIAEVKRGEADGAATKIYNDAYAIDPEFYAFFRTMESYENMIGPGSTLMLDSSSDFFKYMKQIEPDKK